MYVSMTLRADGTRKAFGTDIEMHAYRVTLTDRDGNTLDVPFFTGLGWGRDPDIGDVLSSLALDLSADDIDEAEELGLSLRQYRDLQEQNGRVRAFFGDVLDDIGRDVLEAVEGDEVDLDDLATASDRATENGTKDGTNAAAWFVQNMSDEVARVTLDGIDDGDPAVLDGLPFLDLSGQWADGPSVRSVLEALDLEALDPDSEVASDIVDTYRDAFDAAVSDEVERACRAALDVEGDR